MKAASLTVAASLLGLMPSFLAADEQLPELSVRTAVQIQFPSEAGKAYQLQVSSDVSAPNAGWADYGEILYGTGDLLEVVVSAEKSRNFFRLRLRNDAVAPLSLSGMWVDVGTEAFLFFDENRGAKMRTRSGSPDGWPARSDFTYHVVERLESGLNVVIVWDHSFPSSDLRLPLYLHFRFEGGLVVEMSTPIMRQEIPDFVQSASVQSGHILAPPQELEDGETWHLTGAAQSRDFTVHDGTLHYFSTSFVTVDNHLAAAESSYVTKTDHSAAMTVPIIFGEPQIWDVYFTSPTNGWYTGGAFTRTPPPSTPLPAMPPSGATINFEVRDRPSGEYYPLLTRREMVISGWGYDITEHLYSRFANPEGESDLTVRSSGGYQYSLPGSRTISLVLYHGGALHQLDLFFSGETNGFVTLTELHLFEERPLAPGKTGTFTWTPHPE